MKLALLYAGGGILGLTYLLGVMGDPLATSGPQRLPPIVYTVAMTLGLLVGIGLFLDVKPLVNLLVSN
ncbi:hypothetical protein [Halorussus lipolyticus]|uniref:hypothetical protein n=1 Tax=Halorussus lipolyticus TaxID=3034024 RepID=UPI0023E8D215|nr:hypothetical protein [Halorussus sp. DT80]